MHGALSCVRVSVYVFSERGESGNVFGLIFNGNSGDREHFALSRLVIGRGLLVVKPQLEGMWCNMPVVWSPDPCLESPTNWSAFVPTPFPESVGKVFRNFVMSANA